MPKTPAAKARPLLLGRALESLAELEKVFACCETGDCCRLASARIPPFLVLDFQAKATRSAGNETRSQGFGVQDGGSQFPLGRTPHSWGVTEIRNRDLGEDGLPTDAEASQGSFPDLEGFPGKPRERIGLARFLYRPHRHISSLVCLGNGGASPPTGTALQR